MKVLLLFLFACLVMAAAVQGQTTKIPDISAIGDFRVYSHNDESAPDEAEEFNIADPQFELNIGDYLNPYARADIVIGWHGDHNAEIEEIYATVERGLPLGSSLRVGKYLLEFGRLNPVHPHAYSFIERPLPHQVFFGDEGLAAMALRPSFLIPTGNAYTEFMVGVLKGDVLEGHAHEHEHEEGAEEEEEPSRGPGYFTRLASSFAVGPSSELALGVSALNAIHEIHVHEEGAQEELRTWLLGSDLKYKYRPDRNTALQMEVEGLARIQDNPEGADNTSSYGGYGYLDYRFRQQYNVGGIFEYVHEKEMHEHDEGELEVMEADTWRAGLFVGWAPIEETSLVRLAGHWTDPDEGDGFWSLTAQFVISLGPHKPHNF